MAAGLRRTLLTALGTPVLVIGLVGSSATEIGHIDRATEPTLRESSPLPRTPPAPTEDPVARLVEQHDCWRGAAPADMQGQLPGHVVLTIRTESGNRTRFAGARWIGPALDEVFGHDQGAVVAVHAFCR